MLGEGRADAASSGERSPRWQVAALAASTELAATTLGMAAARASDVALPRLDQEPATVAAVMYAAPSIPALLTRLEQDRRLLTSLARAVEDRFDETHETARGHITMRELITVVTILDAAKCALAVEAATTIDAESAGPLGDSEMPD